MVKCKGHQTTVKGNGLMTNKSSLLEILIAEDNEVQVQILLLQLESFGCPIKVVGNGLQR
ncbi:hypothetical protein BSK66_24980 [Paenibacillus odorifer]|nr:hypothetical protein BSK66_24980 [Paenibacillus odorifer]